MKSLSAIILTLLFVSISSIPLFAQGGATVLFLMINPGAREGGMGEAGVALADDGNAIYWNPAGLAFQHEGKDARKGEATLMHVQWLPQFNLNDMFFDYAAVNRKIKDVGTVGLALQYINYGKNIQTDTQGNELGNFNSNEFAITGSYALKLKKNLGFGVNIKYIYSNLSPGIFVDQERREGRGSTFAVDVATLWHPGFSKKLSLGMNISNIGPKMTFVDREQADPLPTNLRVGFGYDLVRSEYNRLTLVYDANRLLIRRRLTSDSVSVADNVFKAMLSTWSDGSFSDQLKKFTHSVGMEYWYTDLIALRAGYFYENKAIGGRQFWTFGGGLRVSVLQVDFSYIYATIDDHPLADTIRFSLSTLF